MDPRKGYIASIGRIAGIPEIKRLFAGGAELEIENRGRMEIRATERGMSQENLEIIVHGAGIAMVPGFTFRS